jgi:ribonuclease BN (tRNA processing enzyme)
VSHSPFGLQAAYVTVSHASGVVLKDCSMSSRFVVQGSCGAWPEAGRACSGYLLERDGYRVVLDLGYGTLPRLFAVLGSSVADGLDAIIVTHEHPDHMVDLHGLFRARWFGRRDTPAIPMYSPPGVLERVAGLEDDDHSVVREVFDWHSLPASTYEVGPFQLHSMLLPHFVSNAGVRLSSPTLTVAYTGDTGPDPALADLGRNADLYVVEATDRDQQRLTPLSAAARRMGMSGRDAGEAATAANARRRIQAEDDVWRVREMVAKVVTRKHRAMHYDSCGSSARLGSASRRKTSSLISGRVRQTALCRLSVDAARWSL